MNSLEDNLIVEPELEKATKIYRDLMEEIKTRLNAINTLLRHVHEHPSDTTAFINAESAILQLRNVCELMAHCALLAQHPYGLSEELMNSWNARLAFEGLKKLNADCFPRPVRITRADAKISINVTIEESPTLRGLLRCYLRCGKLLHRGIVRHALEGMNKVYDIAWLEDWSARIGKLLQHHAIMVLDQGLILIVHLYGGPDGSVSLAIAKAPGPSRLVEPRREARFPSPKNE